MAEHDFDIFPSAMTTAEDEEVLHAVATSTALFTISVTLCDRLVLCH